MLISRIAAWMCIPLRSQSRGLQRSNSRERKNGVDSLSQGLNNDNNDDDQLVAQIGIDKDHQMTWKQYFIAIILTNGIFQIPE